MIILSSPSKRVGDPPMLFACSKFLLKVRKEYNFETTCEVLFFLCVCFINCSARPGDAAGVGHLSHHVSGVDNLRRSCLDIRMSLDEEENSK